MSNPASALPDPDANSNDARPTPAPASPPLTVVPAPLATAFVVPASAGPQPPEGGTPNASTPNSKPETQNSETAPEQTPRTRSLLNKGQLAELDLDEHVGHTAQKAEYADALATRKIPPAFVTDFLADAAAVRTVNTVIVNTDTSAKEATRHEENCQEKLLTGLRQIQAAARQEYQQTNPIKLEAYLVGERIDASRQMLDQSAATLLKLAAAERPGSLDTEFITRIANCHADSKQADFTQGDQQTDAQKERLKRNAQVVSLKKRRQQIQLAAENLWPHRLPENAPIRRDFRLPRKRPYLG